MHTIKIEGRTFTYNTDGSGDVIITNTAGELININLEMLVEFVGRYYQTEHISAIENMTGIEYLNTISEIRK